MASPIPEPGIFRFTMQPLKDLKDFIAIFFFKADSIIADIDLVKRPERLQVIRLLLFFGQLSDGDSTAILGASSFLLNLMAFDNRFVNSCFISEGTASIFRKNTGNRNFTLRFFNFQFEVS
jgi:hypothetical protein